MDTLRELIGLGFSPAMALVVIAVIILWGSLCGVVALFWRHNNAQRAETRKRIDEMDGHIDACNVDRENLKVQVAKLEERVVRMDKCPRANCPLRLP